MIRQMIHKIIRETLEDPRLPTEYPFKVAVAIYAKRLAIFLGVAVVSLLVGLLLLLLREQLFVGVMALLCVALVLAKLGGASGLVNERIYRIADQLLRQTLQITGAVWLAYEVGRFIQLHLFWDQNALFWAFWVSLLSMVALAMYALDMYYNNMSPSRTLDSKEPPKGSA